MIGIESYKYIEYLKYRYPSAESTMSLRAKAEADKPRRYCVLGALVMDNAEYIKSVMDKHNEIIDGDDANELFIMVSQLLSNDDWQRAFPDDIEARRTLAYLFDFPENENQQEQIEIISSTVIDLNDEGMIDDAWDYLQEKISSYEYKNQEHLEGVHFFANKEN